MSLIDGAIVFAAQAHGAIVFAAQAHGAIEHRRKYTNVPYIVHPLEVMQIVATVEGHTEEMLAAAVLHDVVEDTGVMPIAIIGRFGQVVSDLVCELTEGDFQGNRAARKALEADRLSRISPEAQTVKYADLISNTRSIVEYDEDFARVYLEEKDYLLSVMQDGDPLLWNQALEILIQGREKLAGA